MRPKVWTGTAAWVVRALLACGFVMLLTLLSATRLSPDLLPLGAGTAAWIGGLLFLVPPLADGERPFSAMALAACATGAAAVVALFVAGWGFAIQTPIVVSLMLYLCAAVVRLLSTGLERRLAAGAWLLFLVVLVSAAPVWLGPAIDRLQPETDVINTLIALNPLTHLAVLADIDYLRSDWLYRNSPLGGLRYDYPPPAAVLMGYLIACLLASAAIRVTRAKTGGRRRNGNTQVSLPTINRIGDRPMFAIKHLVAALSLSLLPIAAMAADTPAAPAASEAAPAPALDDALVKKVKRSADDGLHYLRGTQAEDGSWSSSVGVTALALRAFLENRRGYTEEDGPFITRPVKFLLDHVNEDGSISETNHNRNYNTAVAMVALKATNNPAYDEIIKNAQRFLKGLQLDEQDGYEPDHKYYGGVGYGGDERPDLSNIYMALEALKATDFDPEDPLWNKALTFVSRTQNNSETNDLALGGNDGGFAYMPGYSPHGEATSYGGMTSAGLLSLLFAGTDKNDPRVQAAYEWIRANYTLDTNPGAKDNQGLFYYYNAFSKAMRAYGEPQVTDAAGAAHDWRADLATKLLSLQDEDGSWVNKESKRWWEGDPNLCTAWSVIALNQVIGM